MNNFGIPDYIVELSYSLKPGNLNLSERLEDCKNLCETNNIKHKILDVDLHFQKFLDFADLNEREKDMIYVTNFFHSAYLTLHQTLRYELDEPKQYDINILIKVYGTLIKYGIGFTLLKDLSFKEFDKLIKKYNK